jgi:hypothetical protein
MKTTIQISNELRNKLKVASAYYNETYENLLNEVLNLFEKEIPFKTKEEFCSWFEGNHRLLAIKKIVARTSHDYIVQDMEGGRLHVDIELFAKHFLLTPHATRIDYIISAYSSEGKVANVPVISLNMLKSRAMMENKPVSRIAAEMLQKGK